MLTVLMFVAFPVPLTGVYTGTCFAVLLGLQFWQVCLSVIIGNFLCGFIVAILCTTFPQTSIIFYIFVAIIVVFLVYKIVKHLIKNKIQKAM